TGWARVGYAKVKADGEDRYTDFNIYYGECEMLAFSTSLSCSEGSGSSGGGGSGYCGDTFVTIPANPNYASGFIFYMIGGDQNMTFYTETERIPYTPKKTTSPMPQIEKGVLSDNGDGTFSATLRYPPVSISRITSNGETVGGSVAGNIVTFTQHYHGVLIAYRVNGTTVEVQFPNRFNDSVNMMISDKNGECEYQLEGFNAEKVETNSCELGIDIQVNIIETLSDVTIMQAEGKNIYIVPPEGNVFVSIVSSLGSIQIFETVAGTYEMDCNEVKKHAKIFLKVEV
ncbi:MAG: hypothetical protein DRG30_09710, partial [Epsilonproteobacteria bacterium]